MTEIEKIIKPKWISSIKTIGWDLDGTLYRSNPKLSKLMRAKQHEVVARKFGWESERAKREFKRRYKKLGSHTKTLNSFGIDGPAFYTKIWDEVDLVRFIKKDLKIVELFKKLAGKRHFLLSNSNREDQMKRKLRLVGLNPGVFEFIVSTIDVGEVKPDPKPFLVALEKLSLPPGKVLYIGDRESTDILGAKGVGMRTCLVWGESKEADVSLPRVYDVGDLLFG